MNEKCKEEWERKEWMKKNEWMKDELINVKKEWIKNVRKNEKGKK